MFLELPGELLLEIVEWLEVLDAIRLSQTCRMMMQICERAEERWKRLCVENFGYYERPKWKNDVLDRNAVSLKLAIPTSFQGELGIKEIQISSYSQLYFWYQVQSSIPKRMDEDFIKRHTDIEQINADSKDPVKLLKSKSKTHCFRLYRFFLQPEKVKSVLPKIPITTNYSPMIVAKCTKKIPNFPFPLYLLLELSTVGWLSYDEFFYENPSTFQVVEVLLWIAEAAANYFQAAETQHRKISHVRIELSSIYINPIQKKAYLAECGKESNCGHVQPCTCNFFLQLDTRPSQPLLYDSNFLRVKDGTFMIGRLLMFSLIGRFPSNELDYLENLRILARDDMEQWIVDNLVPEFNETVKDETLKQMYQEFVSDSPPSLPTVCQQMVKWLRNNYCVNNK